MKLDAAGNKLDAAENKLDAAGNKLDAAGALERVVNEDSLRKMKARVEEIGAQFFLNADAFLGEINNETGRRT